MGKSILAIVAIAAIASALPNSALNQNSVSLPSSGEIFVREYKKGHQVGLTASEKYSTIGAVTPLPQIEEGAVPKKVINKQAGTDVGKKRRKEKKPKKGKRRRRGKKSKKAKRRKGGGRSKKRHGRRRLSKKRGRGTAKREIADTGNARDASAVGEEESRKAEKGVKDASRADVRKESREERRENTP